MKTFLLAIAFLSCSVIFSQNVVLNNLSVPTDLVADTGRLYLVDSGNIKSIDVSISPAQITPIFNYNGNNGRFISYNNQKIFIPEFNFNILTNDCIASVNKNQGPSQGLICRYPASLPSNLFVTDTAVYFTTLFNSITYVSRTTQNVVKFLGNSPYFIRDIVFFNDKIITLDSTGLRILDLSIPNDTLKPFISNIVDGRNLHLDGSKLYYTESGQFRIMKLNLSVSGASPQVVVANLSHKPEHIAKVGNMLYFTNTNSQLMSYQVNSSTSLEEITTNDNKLTLYPNPSSGLINVTIVSTAKDRILRIFNGQGQLVKQELLKKNSTNQIDLSDNGVGVYYLRVGDITKKLLIVN